MRTHAMKDLVCVKQAPHYQQSSTFQTCVDGYGSVLLGLVIIDKGFSGSVELAFAQFTLDKEDVSLGDVDRGALVAYITSNVAHRRSLGLQARFHRLEQVLDAKGTGHLVLQVLHAGRLVVVLARPRRDDVVGHSGPPSDDEEEGTVGLSRRGDVLVAAEVVLAIDAAMPTPHLAADNDAVTTVDPFLNGDEAMRVLCPLDGVVGLLKGKKRLPDQRGHGSSWKGQDTLERRKRGGDAMTRIRDKQCGDSQDAIRVALLVYEAMQ